MVVCGSEMTVRNTAECAATDCKLELLRKT